MYMLRQDIVEVLFGLRTKKEVIMTEAYDSRGDTLVHIQTVREFMYSMMADLGQRASHHDDSKLEEPEKSVFDEYTPKLRDTTYGSDEYKRFLAEMKVGLAHHYKVNSHHPEHFDQGIAGMNLLDIMEMFCDWMAATQRHADGDIHKSIELNRGRFGYSEQLGQIFHNTVALLEK